MKSIIVFVSFAIVLLFNGCNQTTESTTSDMYVSLDAEFSFQYDSIKIILDNKVLLESRVTTNPVLSLAWSSGLQKLSRNNHTLQFAVVEYGVQKDYQIDFTNDTSTVLMRFDKTTKDINIQQMKGRFLRD